MTGAVVASPNLGLSGTFRRSNSFSMRAVHRIVIEVFCVEGAQNDYDQDRTIQYHPRDIFDSPLAARYPCPDLIGVEELTRQLEDARVGDDKTPGDDDRTNASDPLFVHASSAGIVHESLAWLRTASGEGIEQEEHCDHFDCAPESVRQSASDVPELAPPPPRLPPIIDVPADYRFGPLSIEWMDQNWDVNMGEQSQDDPDTTTGKLPQPSSIPFVTGHTELNYGILHLYREDVTSTVAPRCDNAAGAIIHNSLPTSTATGHAGTSSSAAAASTSSSTSAIGTPDIRLGNDAFTEAYPDVNVICALAVPIHTTLADYLQFIAPMRKRISHFRIVRDSLPNRYMV